MIIKRIKKSKTITIRDLLEEQKEKAEKQELNLDSLSQSLDSIIDRYEERRNPEKVSKTLGKDFNNRDVNVKKFFETNYDSNHTVYEAGVSRFKIDKDEGFNGYADKIQIGNDSYNPITKKRNTTNKRASMDYEEDKRTPYKFVKKNKD